MCNFYILLLILQQTVIKQMTQKGYIAEDPIEELHKYKDLRNQCIEEYQQTKNMMTLLRIKLYQEIIDEIYEKRILK